nr:retrotransposon protein, putative, Ty1-copia subclass [Tanacetum cinerariifolium]
HAVPNLEPMDLEATDASHLQNLEQLDEEFTTTAYPNLPSEDPVIPKEPVNSTRTLSSLQNLEKELSFTNQFFVEKQQEEEPRKTNAEAEVQSMVSVLIHQDTSPVPPITTSVIDLTTSQSGSTLPTSSPTTSTVMTKTTIPPPPPQPQQSSADPTLIKCIDELEQHMANLLQYNLALEEMLDKHGSRLYKLENLNIPHQKRKRRDVPRTPSWSPSLQPPPPPPLTGASGASVVVVGFPLESRTIFSFQPNSYGGFVEDFQLGIESYQIQLNLTKPGWDVVGFEFKHDYTIIESPRAVMFPVNNNERKIMRFNEIYKFSDGTLTQILEALSYNVKEFKIKRLDPGMNTHFWTQKDVIRSKEFIAAIERRLKTRRIYRNLECFIRRDLPRDNPLVSVEVLSFRNSNACYYDPEKCEHASPKVTTSHGELKKNKASAHGTSVQGIKGYQKLNKGALDLNKKSKHNLDSTFLWHCHLDHINKKRIEKLQHDWILKLIDDESFDTYVSCISGKMARKPFTHASERADDLLGIIHSDVCGPFRTASREGGEYLSQEFLDHLRSHGIISQLTPPYTPQHNGVSKRRNQTLLDMVRSMMSLTTLSMSFWGYALECAARILNMVPTKKVNKTPYEMWHEKVSNLSYLKVCGCEALVKRDTPNKLMSTSIKCIFIGYPKEIMGYYFYYPLENKIFVAQYAEFFETNLIKQKASRSIVDFDEIQSEDAQPSEITSLHQHKDHELGDHGEPPKFQVVLLDPESKKWLEAMNAKMKSMKDNQVWSLVDLPSNCKTVGSKWLFKKKTDMDGNIHTYKARLVAKGFTQTYGVDYEETFAPIADIKAIRILISIAAYYDYEIWQMDVKTAFLKGTIDWKSFKQSTTAMSSKEAEYIVAAEAAMEAIWIHKFIYAGASLDRKSTTGGCQFLGLELKGYLLMMVMLIWCNMLVSIFILLVFFFLDFINITNGHQFTMSNRQERIGYSGAMETGKELSNPLMAGSFPKTTLPTKLKPTESEGFAQVVDFLNGISVKYALTVCLAIHTSCIKQFLTSAKVKTVNDKVRIQSLVDGKRVNIKESSIRHIMRLEDADGTSCLTNVEIFEGLARMREVTPLFDNMLVQAPEEVAKHNLPSPSHDPLPSARIEKLESMVERLEEENRVLKELKSVHSIVDSDEPLMEKEKSSKQGRKITDIDADVEINLEKAQAEAYNLDLDHQEKVLRMLDVNDEEPADVEEVLEVVKTAKTEVVTTVRVDVNAASVQDTSITAAEVTKVIVPRKRRGKAILIEEPKPLKRQAQIELDEEVVRQLEAELNANINWNVVIEQVKRSKRLIDAVIKYQPLKRNPLTEAQARRNMIVYLKNMAGYKMDYFKGMSYDEMIPLFESHYNYNQAFLNEGVKVPKKEVSQEKEVEIERSKRKGESLDQEIAKKQKMEQETEELKNHLQIVPDEDDVYTDATPLASKILIIDYKIHTERNISYFKIIRADGNITLFLSFSKMLNNFDREDLESLWNLVRETFAETEPKNNSDDFLLNTLKIMFKKHNVEANVRKDQKEIYGLAKVKRWKLFESCGIHYLTLSTTHIFLLVDRMYPLTHFTLEQMINDVRLEVEDESKMSLELLRIVRRQLNEGYVPQ